MIPSVNKIVALENRLRLSPSLIAAFSFVSAIESDYRTLSDVGEFFGLSFPEIELWRKIQIQRSIVRFGNLVERNAKGRDLLRANMTKTRAEAELLFFAGKETAAKIAEAEAARTAFVTATKGYLAGAEPGALPAEYPLRLTDLDILVLSVALDSASVSEGQMSALFGTVFGVPEGGARLSLRETFAAARKSAVLATDEYVKNPDAARAVGPTKAGRYFPVECPVCFDSLVVAPSLFMSMGWNRGSASCLCCISHIWFARYSGDVPDVNGETFRAFADSEELPERNAETVPEPLPDL
jgi:hypothetical protein